MKSGMPKGLGRALPFTVGAFSAGTSRSKSPDTSARMSVSYSMTTFQPSPSRRAAARAFLSSTPGISPKNRPMMRMTTLYSRSVNSGAKSGMTAAIDGDSPSK